MADDLLRRVIDEVRKELPQITDKTATKIERSLRREFAGEEHYIAKGDLLAAERRAVIDEVRRRFNGRNATTVARELGIGRATVYRIIKVPG